MFASSCVAHRTLRGALAGRLGMEPAIRPLSGVGTAPGCALGTGSESRTDEQTDTDQREPNESTSISEDAEPYRDEREAEHADNKLHI